MGPYDCTISQNDQDLLVVEAMGQLEIPKATNLIVAISWSIQGLTLNLALSPLGALAGKTDKSLRYSGYLGKL